MREDQSYPTGIVGAGLDVPVAESPINQAFSTLDECIEVLDKKLAVLAERLRPYVDDSTLNKIAENSATLAAYRGNSEIAAKINKNIYGLESLSRNIQTLIESLEV